MTNRNILMDQVFVQPKRITKPLLYWLVFEAAQTKYFAFILFLFFLLHPAVPVFAFAEDSVSFVADTSQFANSETTVSENQSPPETEEEVFLDDTTVADDLSVPSEESTSDETQTDEENTVNAELESTVTPTDLALDVVAEGEETLDQATTSETYDDSFSPSNILTATSTVASTTENELDLIDTTEPEVPLVTEVSPNTETLEPPIEVESEPIVVVDTATSSPITATSSEIIYIDTSSDANHITFGSNECVSVAEGSFYCTKQDASYIYDQESVLYAAPDGQGDTEIFMRIDGEVRQLSNNQTDDSAPQFDEISNTVVWHRLLNERYQIIAYDLESQAETVLTSGNENNMEPQHEDGITVWQRWVNNNWEIIMFDGSEEKLITHSDAHDISPDIKQGFVMWSIIDSQNKKSVGIYELKTGQSSTINDEDGGHVTNPRFVLMYDTNYENGDILTKGYNLTTGEIEPLSAAAGNLPQKFPSSDQTGETKALIQSKTSGRELFETENDFIGSSTPQNDEEIEQNNLNSNASATSSIVSNPTIEIPDLVVTMVVSTDATTTANFDQISIPDLVVQPLVSSSSHETI